MSEQIQRQQLIARIIQACPRTAWGAAHGLAVLSRWTTADLSTLASGLANGLGNTVKGLSNNGRQEPPA